MMKHVVIVMTLLVTAGTAMADQQPTATTRIDEYTPEQIRTICTQNGYMSVDPGDGSSAASAPASAEVESCCDRLQRQIDGLRAGLATFHRERARLERRVRLLENPEHAEAQAIVQAEIVQVDAAQATFTKEKEEAIAREFGDIKRKLAEHDAAIKANTAAVEQIRKDNGVRDATVEALIDTDEAQNGSIAGLGRARYAEFGLDAGVLTLAGWDYLNVSGSLGVQLALRIGERWYWYGAPAMLATADGNPFGAMFRTGLGYDLSTAADHGSLEFGGMMTTTLLNAQFEGKYVTAEPTIGLVYRFADVFRAGIFAHGGPRADADGGLSGTIGGGALLGVDLPH